MSIARWGCDGSDVYLFVAERSGVSGIECCECPLNDGDYFATSSAEMLEHLDRHRAKGDTVPEDAYQEIREIR